MKPGERPVAGQPTAAARPSRSSISAHSAAVRWSFQRIAGRRTRSSLVEDDEPVHLAGEADRRDLGDTQLSQRRLGCAPPVLGILLGPAGRGRRERVVLLRAREHLALGRERERLDAGRADVEADERRHLDGRDRPRAIASRREAVVLARRGGRSRRRRPTRRPLLERGDAALEEREEGVEARELDADRRRPVAASSLVRA